METISLKVGDLYVALTASTSQFSRSMEGVLKSTARVSRELRNLTKDAAQVGLGLGAAVAGAVAAASKVNKEVANATSRLTSQFTSLSNEVATAALPSIRELSAAVGGLVRWIRELDPEVKAQVVEWAKFAVQAGAASMVLSKVFGALGSIASIGATIGPTLVGALGSPVFLPALAAMAGIVLLIGAAKQAWDAWGTSIKESVLEIREVQQAVLLLIAAWNAATSIGDKFARVVLGKKDSAFDKDPALKAFALHAAGNDPLARGAVTGEYGGSDAAAQVAKDAATNAMDSIKKTFAEGMGVLGDVVGVLTDKFKAMLPVLPEFKAGAVTGLEAPSFEELFGRSFEDWQEGQLAGPRASDISTASPVLDAVTRTGKGLASQEMFANVEQTFLGSVGTFIRGISGAFAVATDRIGAAILQGSGAFGAAVSGFMEGFGATGTAEGGAVGALAALLTQSESFNQVLSVLSDVFGILADTVGLVLRPVLPVIVALGGIARGLYAFAEAIYDVIGGGGWTFVFEAVKFLGITILEIVRGLGLAWNHMIRALSELSIFGATPFADLADRQMDLGGLGDAIGVLTDMTWDSALAQAELATTARDVSEALLNVPSGYSVAGARHRILSGGGGGSPISGGDDKKSGGGAGGPAPVNVIVELDGKDIVKRIRVEERRDRYNSGGSPLSRAPRYAGA